MIFKIFVSKRMAAEPTEDTGTFPDGYVDVALLDKDLRDSAPKSAYERDYGALRKATEIRHGFA